MRSKIQKNSLRIAIGLVSYLVLFGTVNAQQTAIDSSLTYLPSTQSVDGTWGGTTTSLNTVLQTTTTTARTFQILKITDPTLTNAITFLANQAPNTVDDLAQQLKALAASGADVSTQITTLKTAQQTDGGWGLDLDKTFTSETINTVSTLRALNIANAADNVTLSGGLGFLRGIQNPDGDWEMVKGEESHVYYPVQVILAFKGLRPEAFNYLVVQQHTDGSFGEPVGIAFETTLVPQNPGFTSLRFKN